MAKNWQETVLPRVEIFKGSTPKPVEQVEALLEKQAKTTWEARQKEVEQLRLDYDRTRNEVARLRKEVDEAEQRGIIKSIKEVADGINEAYEKCKDKEPYEFAKAVVAMAIKKLEEAKAFLKSLENGGKK